MFVVNINYSIEISVQIVPNNNQKRLPKTIGSPIFLLAKGFTPIFKRRAGPDSGT